MKTVDEITVIVSTLWSAFCIALEGQDAELRSFLHEATLEFSSAPTSVPGEVRVRIRPYNLDFEKGYVEITGYCRVVRERGSRKFWEPCHQWDVRGGACPVYGTITVWDWGCNSQNFQLDLKKWEVLS